MVIKFDIEKFFRERDFGLWKLKMIDKDCSKGTEVVEELKSISGGTPQRWCIKLG